MKEVNNQILWIFDLGSKESMNYPICIFIGFQQRNRQDSQTLNNDIFYTIPITSAQSIIATEKYPDAGILLNYVGDDYCQVYGQIKEAFIVIRKSAILPPKISDFRSSNVVVVELRYNSYVFDIKKSAKFHSFPTNQSRNQI